MNNSVSVLGVTIPYPLAVLGLVLGGLIALAVLIGIGQFIAEVVRRK